MSILSKLTAGTQEYFAEFWASDIGQNVIKNKWSITGGLIGTYCLYKIITRPRNLPPGPRGLPFIGAMNEVTDNLHKDLVRMSKEYNSDVVSLYVGGELTVGLNSADAIREAFLKSEDFSDRGRFGEFFDLQDQLLSNSRYTERWRKLKSTIMSSLRTHGFGTQKSEEQINLQLVRLTEFLEEKKGAPISNTETQEIGTKAASSVLMKMIASQSYDFDDPELIDMIDRINGYQQVFFEAFSIFIWMEILPMWVIYIFVRSTINQCINSAAGLRKILMGHLKEHETTLDERNPRDYLDDMIIGFRNDPTFTNRMLIDTTIVFLPDATETLSTAITWCIFHLCQYAEYQEKMVQEISSLCGANTPALKDRGRLVLCEAVMLESMRKSSQAGFSGAHTCSKDVKFRGYTIPKGSAIQANLYAVHHDEKIFPEPEKFKPHRFISNGKIANTENLMPFGLGRRKCPGDPLTKAQIFIYITGIVQRFEIKFAKGHEPKTYEGEGVFCKAPDCKMTFTPR